MKKLGPLLPQRQKRSCLLFHTVMELEVYFLRVNVLELEITRSYPRSV